MTAPPGQPSIQPTGVNVLVVDDHADNRKALRAILSSPAFNVVEAASGSEALRKLLVEEFAVLLIDVVMPDIDGFDLATAVREREKTASVPILFLTAHATDHELVNQGYRLGAVDYLTKPLSAEMVRAKVSVFAQLYLQRKHIERQAQRLVEAEQKQAELRLLDLRLANERRYHALAEAVPHIIWTAQPDGSIDYFNRRWFEYTGVSAELAGGDWMVALHPEDLDRCSEAWQEAREVGAIWQTEVRLREASGDYRWHLAMVVPEYGSGAQITSWLGTLTDIDDQKRAHAVLAEFKGTLDAVLDAVLIFEPETLRFLYVNEGARVLWNRPRNELAKMHPFELMTGFDRDGFRSLLLPVLTGKKSAIKVETLCLRSDGTEIPVELSFQLVRTDSDHIVSIARDITQRKAAEAERQRLLEEAVAAVKARDEFLSVASHELRSPLQALKLQVEMLTRPPESRKDAAPTGWAKQKLEGAARQIERLAAMVSELMDVSRIGAGRLHIDREQTDLSTVARETIDAFREEAAKAGCAVTLHAPGSVVGEWDRLRMTQIVTNLLGNAFKFGAGKPIDVFVEPHGRSARLRVQDHGIGIAPDNLERIFQCFEQVKTEKRYAGLGLGLYIVKQIVEAHGGKLGVESQLGVGSTFTVELPVTHSEAHVEGEPSEARPRRESDSRPSLDVVSASRRQ